jgi:hypothetical protein
MVLKYVRVFMWLSELDRGPTVPSSPHLSQTLPLMSSPDLVLLSFRMLWFSSPQFTAIFIKTFIM